MNGPGYLAVAIQPGPNTNLEAFHEWYNTEHGPLRLRLPFFLTGDRYTANDGKKPEWSAVYDVTDISWLEKRIYTRMREERSQREKDVMSTFESLDRKIYKTISTRGDLKRPGPIIVATTAVVKEENLDEFNKWYEEEHVVMLSKTPGWLRTRRFQLVAPGLKGMPPAGQVECLAVHDYEEKNGLGGPEHTAAQKTPWRQKVAPLLLSMEMRQWKHYVQLEALHEDPSTVITTDGAELRFQLEGDPSAPVVALVNPILTNFHIWDDVAKALTSGAVGGKPFRVLRYNARGYSQQAARSNPTRFDLLADDLEYLISRLNIEKLHAVVGCSMGGVTSLNFAIKHPDKLEKFVACDCNTASSEANNKAWGERIEHAKEKGIDSLADITVKRWFTEPNHDSPAFKKVLPIVASANFDGFVQNTGALCNYDLKPHLASIKTPGLLIAGEGDGKLPEAMRKFGIPNATFKGIPNAGHLPMLENPDAFLQALGSFL
ncbi:alpha/beta-hydrolase [Teratosphaeria nubilosa]|uniref:Alpha/beta-hydrolase n=1 Tax=Teratosphaeria nubilosa TaxID=161662 RepID=A0A6G1L8M6_9PEZI|nr:alpha/beta-hydrolase [Teratosphaeria nubilosa]